jgi:hypothetical protein
MTEGMRLTWTMTFSGSHRVGGGLNGFRTAPDYYLSIYDIMHGIQSVLESKACYDSCDRAAGQSQFSAPCVRGSTDESGYHTRTKLKRNLL